MTDFKASVFRNASEKTILGDSFSPWSRFSFYRWHSTDIRKKELCWSEVVKVVVKGLPAEGLSNTTSTRGWAGSTRCGPMVLTQPFPAELFSLG